MSVFTTSELEYLRGGGTRRLARLATVGSDNTPHVEIRGRAEVVSSPRPLIRIHPERIVSWGLDAREAAAKVG
jgi:hypothetical protein